MGVGPCDGSAMGGRDPNFHIETVCVIFTSGGTLRKRVLDRFGRERSTFDSEWSPLK